MYTDTKTCTRGASNVPRLIELKSDLSLKRHVLKQEIRYTVCIYIYICIYVV